MSITLDGVDDVLTGDTTDDVLTENGAMTIYTRFRTTATPGAAQQTVVRRTGAVGATRLLIDDNTGASGLGWVVTGATDLEAYASTALVNNTEYVAVITWDGSVTAANVNFYLNSITADSHAFNANGVAPVDNSDAALLVGNNAAGTVPISAIIREMAIFNNVISANDISLLVNSKTRNNPLRIGGCLRYWRMDDERSGSADGHLVRDYTVSQKHLTGGDGANNTGCTWTVENVLYYIMGRKTLSPIGTRIGSRQAVG